MSTPLPIPEIEQIKTRLEQDYLLIKKNQVFYLIGGAIATTVAIVAFSWAGALGAIRSTAGVTALSEITKMRDKASADLAQIETVRKNATALKIQSGRIVLKHPAGANHVSDIQAVEKFTVPFNKKPTVVLAISDFNFPQQSHSEINLQLVTADENGFTCSALRSNPTFRLDGVVVSWIAYSE